MSLVAGRVTSAEGCVFSSKRQAWHFSLVEFHSQQAELSCCFSDNAHRACSAASGQDTRHRAGPEEPVRISGMVE